ncbi:hypothetical protein EST38_g2234 [Candolleomyces aberdarensis]|uniref:Uncharacterized protein n=1 Tax=Candolleomyces aberdarensis TaxID=2316362 RepID=A0A4Q2DSZ4_9AGAR|nr:hypothetical protein EST38_g2234 [Candolleomyces aberdarensis]
MPRFSDPVSTRFIAIHASALALLIRFLQTIVFTKFPIPNIVCMPARTDSKLLGGVFALLLGSVIIVMFIMMYIAFRKHRNFNSTLLSVFYRDGIFYFICLSALASANIVVNLAAPEGGFKFLLVQTEIDLHVILSTRMLLHLRSWAERDKRRGFNGDALTGTLAGLEYSTAVGNRTTVEYTMDPKERERRAPSPMMFAEKDQVVESRPGRAAVRGDARRVWEQPRDVGVESGVDTIDRKGEKEEVVVVVERREDV